MPKFSEHFDLPYTQPELDFFDCNPAEDRPLYVDPFAISQMGDVWSIKCQLYMETFYEALLKAVASNDLAKVISMTSHFGEPGDTFIGVSSGEPRGRGVGRGQARQIIRTISKSKAVQSGMLSDLADIPLFLHGIGRDKISDLTTNVIREILYDYTISQCELHDVKMVETPCHPFWSPEEGEWLSCYKPRPRINGKPILLLPKRILRHDVALQGQSFYDKGMVEFLKAEHERNHTKLVHYVKKRKSYEVYKSRVKEEHPYSKDKVSEFIADNPNFFNRYKTNLKVMDGIDLVSICTDKDQVVKFNPRKFAKNLASELALINAGREDAEKYHKFILGALTFLFYPSLTNPAKEHEINEGRKRIDIVFDNSASKYFFHRMAIDPSTAAKMVVVECKNYSNDIANPEFDQLIGRFDVNRGKLGIITCRSDSNPQLTMKRCKDAVKAGQGIVMVLTDEDIIQMLNDYDDFYSASHLKLLDKKLKNLIS